MDCVWLGGEGEGGGGCIMTHHGVSLLLNVLVVIRILDDGVCMIGRRLGGRGWGGGG